jgi:hypothetical protein
VVDETRSEPPKIKVVDRRKFTTEGDPLEVTEPVAEAPDAEEPVADETPVQKTEPDVRTGDLPGQSSARFLELVAMLAGQAELLLVGSEEVPAQPTEAQRVIDYLGVIEEKTKGNLSAEESNLLSSMLYQLRTFFLQRK